MRRFELNGALAHKYQAREAIKNIAPDDFLNRYTFYKHIGIYGYRTTTLGIISKLKVSNLEKAEMLEQLRWIENGFKIKAAITKTESLAIDIPADVEAVLKALK